MHPLANTVFHVLLVLAWCATGYASQAYALHPCAEHAAIAAVQAANACALLWAVWPRKAVCCG